MINYRSRFCYQVRGIPENPSFIYRMFKKVFIIIILSVFLNSIKPLYVYSDTPASQVDALDIMALQMEMISDRQTVQPISAEPILPDPLPIIKPKREIIANTLRLDESFSSISQPINIEQGKSILISGKNIKKFLVTQPEIIYVTRKISGQLVVEAKNIGYTYLHVWDEDNKRWTIELLTVIPKAEDTEYEKRLRFEESRAGNFKFRYALDWSATESGRGVSTLKRNNYSWAHNLSLTGESPYGNIDAAGSVRANKKTTQLTYSTIGLTDGKIGNFKDFAIRGMDFSPHFSNLAFPGLTLRGGMVEAAAFNKKINYSAFGGEDSGGRFGDLPPGVFKKNNAYINGLNVDYSLTKNQIYKFSLLHGWGTGRESYLRNYSYDWAGGWNLSDQLGASYEMSYDSKKLGQLLRANYKRPKLNFNMEFRDIDKKFLSISGTGWRQGELGGLFNLNLLPTEKLNIITNLDVYRDRLFPALDNPTRFNEDLRLDTVYQVNPTSNLNLNYTLQNDLGKLSQVRYQSVTAGGSKSLKVLKKDVNLYLRLGHQENKNYSSPSISYIDDKIYGGVRIGLIGALYYYVNQEMNWLEEKYTGKFSIPSAREMGLDWSDNIGKTPFSGSMRFIYRDEEHASSPLSFLAGQDYIEGYTELNYKQPSGTEIFGSCRVRNTWADKVGIAKQVEATFNAGLRYIWDTGLRWDSVGDIEGYVFKDLNSDGLRQRDEPPIEGVRVWLGKDKFQITDIFGYYKFKGARGRQAYISIDMLTVPKGYLLTVMASQAVVIQQNQIIKIDFGLMTRSEISGIIFEDKNDSGKFDSGDIGIIGAIVSLESGEKSKTDSSGRYAFTKASPGEHTVILDLDSLPIYYMPTVPIKKELVLFEGMTYIYNIPVLKSQE